MFAPLRVILEELALLNGQMAGLQRGGTQGSLKPLMPAPLPDGAPARHCVEELDGRAKGPLAPI